MNKLIYRFSECRRTVLAGVALMVLLVFSGCTTTESDMPWNAPASWEGSPTLPGLSQGTGF